MKILRVKLEYWLPGITIGLVEPGSQFTSALNKNKLKISEITPSFPLTPLEFEVKKNKFVSVTVNGLKTTSSYLEWVHLEKLMIDGSVNNRLMLITLSTGNNE